MKKTATDEFLSDQGGQHWFAPASAPLSNLVVCYVARQSLGHCERFSVFPSARVELLFNFGSPYKSNSLAGQALRTLNSASLLAPRVALSEHQCGPHTDWFLVQLTVSGCQTLLGSCLGDFLQRDCSLRDVIGVSADELYERLAGAHTFLHRTEIFSDWVFRRTLRSRISKISAFCEYARVHPVGKVGSAASFCGIGERRLRDIFHAEMGMSPKTWHCIVRAERLWQTIHPSSRANRHTWLEYSDESHAHREFKKWTGLTIGQYQSIKSTGDGLVNGGARLIVPM